MELHQPDLLFGCIKKLTDRNQMDDLTEEFLDAIGDSVHGAVLTELSSFLRALEGTGAVDYTEVPQVDSNQLSARLPSITGSDGAEITYFFKVKDAISASLLPILGVILALSSHAYPSATLQIANVSKNLWSHLIALHHENDLMALKVIDAVSALRARNVANRYSILSAGKEFPSTEEVSSHLSDSPYEDIMAGLRRLEALRLIECKQWGGQAGDLTNKANRWGERI